LIIQFYNVQTVLDDKIINYPVQTYMLHVSSCNDLFMKCLKFIVVYFLTKCLIIYNDFQNIPSYNSLYIMNIYYINNHFGAIYSLRPYLTDIRIYVCSPFVWNRTCPKVILFTPKGWSVIFSSVVSYSFREK